MSLRRSRVTAGVLVTLGTFIDIVAYSVAAPVLPDLSRRLGASPTMIGLLFASFGLTLLATSIPMGAASDRIGRKGPMVAGLLAVSAATMLFAFAGSLPWLFAARLVQGAGDAVTWVVGFALLADLYEAEERGRVMGFVMSGTGVALILGPSLGGWLYQLGGLRLPFISVSVVAAAVAAAFLWLEVPHHRAASERVPIADLIRTPTVASCVAAVVAISGTVTMLEPVLSLHLATLGVGPAGIGTVFASGAVASAVLNPLVGRMTDRWGARRLMLLGLALDACALSLLGTASSYRSAIGLFVLQVSAMSLAIMPSLSLIAEVTPGSFGAAYGLYNFAWGVGLLAGPAIGGALFERLGFSTLSIGWSICLLIVAGALFQVQSSVRSKPDGFHAG